MTERAKAQRDQRRDAIEAVVASMPTASAAEVAIAVRERIERGFAPLVRIYLSSRVHLRAVAP